jgi:putative proteasome-type protease
MTYCLAVKTHSGIVLASDSRTNAGLDYVNSYSKMHTFSVPGERAFALLTAGNLGTTQAVVHRLRRDIEDANAPRSLRTVDYLFDAAEYVGTVSCQVQAHRCAVPKTEHINFEATFILGGQIKGRSHEIVLIYPEGNYITASPANPFLQIGETKYGKPILDRIVSLDTTLEAAARCALVSIDSTMRSNVSVGPPIDLAIYNKDSFEIGPRLTLEADSGYYLALREGWGTGIKEAFDRLPKLDL